jgi:hypothetical protein
MAKKVAVSKEILTDLFINQKLDRDEISRILNIKRYLVNYYLRKYDIFHKSIDLTGQKIGKLLILEQDIKESNNRPYYKCKCECGKTIIVAGYNLTSQSTKSCGCSRIKNCFFTGYKEIYGSYWKNLQTNALRRKLEFTITIEEVWDIYIKQNKKCALSDIDIRFSKSHRDDTQTASLDRIDSDKGYIQGNVQWVHKNVNLMKWNLKQEYFLEMCKKIYRKNYE